MTEETITAEAGNDALAFCEGARSLPVRGVRAGRQFAVQDWVADEVPVALEYNGVSHAVMLATPLDLEDFALGFSLSEGILDAPHELFAVEEERSEIGITLHLEVAGGPFARLKERRRTLTGRTGCGLCGTESLEHVARNLPVLPGGPTWRREAIGRAMSQFCQLQTLQQATGAVHAAAWCSAEGEVMWLREDVGRHNALDKLIGALAANGIEASTGFIAVTSRASFEMVQKTAMAGVSLLAAVSAPTSFAVATAQRARMTLVGFARQQDLVVYCHSDRLSLGSAAGGEHAH
ncbi:formate dehydrogenase accessory sulfurtransferase FdhD [Variovorax saccharolyticus]|uniref:formate dehydrogenase accessory sulfurtransferase FdhD n=1 Tax=Variovorax saccharolyticus TaxID=3053516 RepID=UPI002575D5CA|nr:formate dehydrogenase accessory sulfurtransferase FdhD [Variovorax sp. J31P216]MDM0026647.1 formate dehydrogenase accessory sulfurtransferase FdhD [Variovorax sp. J31P216]